VIENTCMLPIHLLLLLLLVPLLTESMDISYKHRNQYMSLILHSTTPTADKYHTTPVSCRAGARVSKRRVGVESVDPVWGPGHVSAKVLKCSIEILHFDHFADIPFNYCVINSFKRCMYNVYPR